jgi:hypothetical protein
MIQAFCVDSNEIRKAREANTALTHEMAVRRLAKPVQVEVGHPAYDSLAYDLPAVVEGVLYDLTLERLIS